MSEIKCAQLHSELFGRRQCDLHQKLIMCGVVRKKCLVCYKFYKDPQISFEIICLQQLIIHEKTHTDTTEYIISGPFKAGD